MNDAQDEAKQYVYIEPMGRGSHFVAELAQSSIIPGTVQLHVLRGDGSIDRTIGMNGEAIFRWTNVSRENALILAQQLEQRASMYDVSIPQRLLLEAQSANKPPAERQSYSLSEMEADDSDDTEDSDDEDEAD